VTYEQQQRAAVDALLADVEEQTRACPPDPEQVAEIAGQLRDLRLARVRKAVEDSEREAS
jgi:hypothetical protein